MFDSMRVMPQIVPKRQSIKRKEDEEKNKQTTQTESEGGSTNLAQSRGLQYVQDLQEGKQPRRPVKEPVNYTYNNNINVQRPTTPTTTNIQSRSVGVPSKPVAAEPAKTETFNYANFNPKINIAQVIGDFKNTAHAIGTPEDIFEDVNMYLSLVEKQTKKDGANVKVVQTNLRNAAGLLDEYISNTLNKESKVVENWVEAIFLQQVDYKYNTEDINEAFLVQMPEDQKTPETSDEQQITQTEQQPVEATKPQIDAQIRNWFASAKMVAQKGNTDLALSNYQRALERSKEVGDSDSESKVHFEMGKIYDKNDDLPKALESYNNAVSITKDNNVKIKAHYAMGQIYDDVNQFKPAIEHYMAAISFAGESENFKAQIKSLTKIGDIFTDKYDKEAFNVYSDAEVVAEESKDAKNKGYVSNSIATAYDKFNKPTEALKYYSNAVKNYTEAGLDEKVAENYKYAGELLIDYNKVDKGKNLIKKAIAFAKKANNENLLQDLEMQLA